MAPDGDPRRKITELLGVVISLSVTNPRITEWLRPESVFRLSADTFDSCNFQTVQNNTRFLAILRIDKGVLHNSASAQQGKRKNSALHWQGAVPWVIFAKWCRSVSNGKPGQLNLTAFPVTVLQTKRKRRINLGAVCGTGKLFCDFHIKHDLRIRA